MIACLAGAAGIALVIFVVIFIYLKSKNNFNYLKKTESQKKAPFNANRKFFFNLTLKFTLKFTPNSPLKPLKA